ncbi:hypothetical protein FJ658_03345 [Schumannella sp. 10F1B-5-1]|nr:hypothetical protein FJ658_03345 [Schumannella sp. 10F1B-5-1]
MTADSHEHGWRTESSHATSEGRVVYVRCDACGRRRVDLQTAVGMPPAAVSRVAPVEQGGSRSIVSSADQADVSAETERRARQATPPVRPIS